MIPHQRALSRLAQITWHYRFRKSVSVPYAPYRLWIEPTNRCNLSCVMCPNKDLPPDSLGFMDFDLFRSIADQAAGHVHDVNLHHRGEPTLHPRLTDMIRYADGHGMKVKLHTNASALTETLSKDLIRSGLRLISFSFDGYTAGVYESVRVGARFERGIGNIRRFLELKRELGAERLRTVMEVMELGDEPPDPAVKREFIGALRSRGLDRLIVKKPHNWAGNVALDTLESPAVSACTFPWHALVVLWDGRAGSCPHDFFADIVYGDLKNEPLLALFNGPVIRDLRSRMLKRRLDALGKPCNRCDSVQRRKMSGIPLASLKYLRD
jgi:hypothetical protein